MTIAINDKLYKDIESYCTLNELGDTEQYINSLLKKAFTIEKYGEKPGVTQKEIIETEKKEVQVVDGGVIVELADEKKSVEAERDEVEDDINSKNLEFNKSLKDDMFNDELSDETPVVDKPVVTKRKLKRKLS